MANITENTQSPAWSDGIYQIETSDPVLGGANGIANRQAKELAARTQWLKTELAKAVSSIGTNKSSADSAIATKANNTLTLTAGNGLTGGGNLTANRTFTLGTPSSITADSTNSVTSTSHTHAISKASTGTAGIVQLHDGLGGEYTDRALTAAQGKALNDKITAANKTLNNAVLTTGDQEISGHKTFNTHAMFKSIALKNQVTPVVQLCSTSGTEALQISSQGAQGTHSFDIRTHENGAVTGSRIANFLLPSKTGSHTLATTSDISEATAATSASLATKTDKTTTITAGNGLTGGGNLSANRTLTLGTPASITADSTNSVTGTSHTHAISKASTSQAGIVALYNALNADYTDRALTAAQGKVLNDKFTNIPQVSGLDLDTTTQTLFFKNAKSGYPTAENGGHEVGNEHSGFIVGWNGECMQFVNGGDRLFIRGNDLDISQNAWAEWGQVLTNKIGLRKTDIAIATGTINDGETIPLPSGFTQEQCKWFVSITDSDKAIKDIEGFSSVSYNFTATADSNRVVTSKIIYEGYSNKTASCQASYIIIGKK